MMISAGYKELVDEVDDILLLENLGEGFRSHKSQVDWQLFLG